MTARKMSPSLPVSPTSSSFLRRTVFGYTTLLFCAVLSLICYHSQDGPIWKSNFFSRESDDVELTDSLKEPNFRNALLYSLIIAIPMVADSLLDFALLSNRFQERLHWYSRALVLFALVAPNLLLLTFDFGKSTNMAYLCGYRFFRVACVLSAGSVTATVAFKNKNIASDGFLAVLQLGIIGFMVKGVGMFCNPPLYDTLDQLSLFTRFLSLLTLLHSGLLKYVYRDSIFLTRMLEPTELTVLTYAVSLSAMHIGFEIVIMYMKRFSCDCITSFVFIQMAFVVTITVLQSRINRMEHVRQSKFNEERQAFIRYISHEIRTPLNTVFLGLEFLTIELLKLHPGSDNILVLSLIDIVRDIQSPCQISLAILDDLLTFDKVEGGKMTLDLKHIGCCDFIVAVVKPFCLNAKEKGIDFSTNFNLVSKQFIIKACIHVDPSKMGQVIRNLLSNAIKFTPVQGKVVITLKHEITAPDRRVESTDCIEKLSSLDEFAAGDHWLRIEVADSGAGISTLDQSKLFGQYVQFNANKLQEGKGSGLGLWISKGIAELHGGIIGVYSEGEGKGSTFYLDLPVHFHESDNESESEDGNDEETKYEIEEKTNRTSMTVDDRAHTSPPTTTISSEGNADMTVVKFAATPCTSEHSSRHAVPSPTCTIQASNILSASATATATATGIVPPSLGFYTCTSHIRCPTDTRDSSTGFLSSADHFMVTSTPASRSSERVIRSTGIVSLESYEDYFLETSGRASPACIVDSSGNSIINIVHRAIGLINTPLLLIYSVTHSTMPS